MRIFAPAVKEDRQAAEAACGEIDFPRWRAKKKNSPVNGGKSFILLTKNHHQISFVRQRTLDPTRVHAHDVRRLVGDCLHNSLDRDGRQYCCASLT